MKINQVQDHRLRRGVPRQDMLVIHPDECIDCGVCVPECPVDAIKADTEPGLKKWTELNREYAQKWPNITAKKDMPKDARAYWDETRKFDKYFSANWLLMARNGRFTRGRAGRNKPLNCRGLAIHQSSPSLA
jgi:ferredoxin